MAKETCQSRDITLTEATLEETTLEEDVEKQDWIQVVNDQVSFHYLTKAKGNKCPYGPFKDRFHLNDHMRIIYLIIFFKA